MHIVIDGRPYLMLKMMIDKYHLEDEFKSDKNGAEPTHPGDTFCYIYEHATVGKLSFIKHGTDNAFFNRANVVPEHYMFWTHINLICNCERCL